MGLTTFHRGSWFGFRLALTAVLAFVLVFGRLPLAGAVEETADAETTVGEDAELKTGEAKTAGVKTAQQSAEAAPTEPASEEPASTTPAATEAPADDSADEPAPKIAEEAAAELEPAQAPKKTTTAGSGAPQRTRRIQGGPVTQAVVSDGSNPSADLDQWANLPDNWQNGNLKSSNSKYIEGDTVPFRMRLADLGIDKSHTLTVEWDATKSGTHAYDYIQDFDETETAANPCTGSGLVLCDVSAPTSTKAIPLDPQVTRPAQVAGAFKMWGATIDSVDTTYAGPGTTATDGSRRITIRFTSLTEKALVASGGHISSRIEWDPETTAAQISGSPYHMRLHEISGKSGNQDRSLSANSVFIPLIDLDKSANYSTAAAGTEVTYTYRIKNIGEMELTDISLEDDKLGDLTSLLPAAADPLSVGEEHTITKKYTLTNGDAAASPLKNIADVYGTASSGDQATDQDTVSITVNPRRCRTSPSARPPTRPQAVWRQMAARSTTSCPSATGRERTSPTRPTSS